nr:hypothetical protein [Tanacetum cinerariifolium]
MFFEVSLPRLGIMSKIGGFFEVRLLMMLLAAKGSDNCFK